MEAFRQQIQSHRKTNQTTKPLLEEFIPLKNPSPSTDQDGSVSEAKATNNWISSAQLWSSQETKGSTPSLVDGEADIKLALNGKQRSVIEAEGTTRTLYPFSSSKEGLPELALASSCKEVILGEKKGSPEKRDNNMSTAAEKEMGSTNGNHQRKARRCWSPDLHRRFVNALHMLGGSQGCENTLFAVCLD